MVCVKKWEKIKDAIVTAKSEQNKSRKCYSCLVTSTMQYIAKIFAKTLLTFTFVTMLVPTQVVTVSLVNKFCY